MRQNSVSIIFSIFSLRRAACCPQSFREGCRIFRIRRRTGWEVSVRRVLRAGGRAGADGFIRVIIKDSGCGIPAEHLPNVKKKFYKANQNVRGNGIGLAVANEIMELHSGSLDIDSEEGMGTTVIITIPTMKKLEMNPELSNTTQIPTATAQVQVVERKQD